MSTTDPATRPAVPVRPRPRWFPETPHEDAAYGQWRTEAAANPGLPRFRDWYEARFPVGAPAAARSGGPRP